MNNHERAKRAVHAVLRELSSDKLSHDQLQAMYRAVEGEILDATEEPAPQTQPQPRPAFIGDEVDAGDYDRGFVEGESVSSPSAIVGFGFGCHRPVHLSKLTHLDGTPVSRIVEHRRPIPVSERLPTKEDADAHGEVLAFWEDGDFMGWGWDNVSVHRSIVAWLPAPESGVE